MISSQLFLGDIHVRGGLDAVVLLIAGPHNLGRGIVKDLHIRVVRL